jgi:hypothetical protein
VSDEPTSNETPQNPETPNIEFDGEYDAERAKRKIAAMAADKAKLQERLAKFEREAQERAEAEKTEYQKAIERAERAEKALAEREAEKERSKALKKALKDHGLDEEDAELLDGVPADKLEARAQALAKRLGKSKKDTEEPIPGKPKPKLAPGHKSPVDANTRVDANAIADRIANRRY